MTLLKTWEVSDLELCLYGQVTALSDTWCAHMLPSLMRHALLHHLLHCTNDTHTYAAHTEMLPWQPYSQRVLVLCCYCAVPVATFADMLEMAMLEEGRKAMGGPVPC